MACFSTTDQKIEMLVSKCTERYATAREAYRYLDETNNGFITALDMQVVFRRLLQFDLDVGDAQDILDRFAGRRGAARLAYDAFARAYHRSGVPPRAGQG